jgi:hypothetical protein
MAPYDRLGAVEWSGGQSDGVRRYVAAVLEGEEHFAQVVVAEDAELRANASTEDARDAEVFEQTRLGIGGWVDDELAAFRPWEFDPHALNTPTRIW